MTDFSNSLYKYCPTEKKLFEIYGRIQQVISKLGIEFPLYCELLELLEVRLDMNTERASISPDGVLAMNPAFVLLLDTLELRFVVMHELYHLIFQASDRESPTDNFEKINIAHDFIINDMLREEGFGTPDGKIPVNALDWREFLQENCPEQEKNIPDARFMSLEQLYYHLECNGYPKRELFSPSRITPAKISAEDINTSEGISLDNILMPGFSPDTWNGYAKIGEGEMFSDRTPVSRRIYQRKIKHNQYYFRPTGRNFIIKIKQAILGVWKVQSLIRQGGKKVEEQSIQILQSMYAPNWETMLQQWLDSIQPADRSFAQASRRGAWRTDVVLPGRKREGFIVHVLLDVRPKLKDKLVRFLGSLQMFCEGMDVGKVHVVQCINQVLADDYLDTDQLPELKIQSLKLNKIDKKNGNSKNVQETTETISIPDDSVMEITEQENEIIVPEIEKVRKGHFSDAFLKNEIPDSEISVITSPTIAPMRNYPMLNTTEDKMNKGVIKKNHIGLNEKLDLSKPTFRTTFSYNCVFTASHREKKTSKNNSKQEGKNNSSDKEDFLKNRKKNHRNKNNAKKSKKDKEREQESFYRQNNMQMAFTQLASDPEIQAVLVFSDGKGLKLPTNEPPFRILWAICNPTLPLLPYGQSTQFF